MARRAVVAGVAFAAALAGTVTPPADAVIWSDTCDAALPMAGAIAGTVGFENTDDWFRHPVVPGRYLVTLESSPADADLSVGDGSCAGLCGSSEPILPDTCDVRVDDGWLTIGVWSGSKRLPANYVVTLTPLGPAVSACSDRIDNDSDGLIDFPADAGCEGATDATEDTAVCETRAGAEVCFSLVPGTVEYEYGTEVPDLKSYKIAAYVEEYVFARTLPVSCVVLVRNPGNDVNPCQSAGGRFRKRTHTLLYPIKRDLPSSPLVHANVVQVCDSTLTATVNGVGPTDEPILALC